MKRLVWNAGAVLVLLASSVSAAPSLSAANITGKPGQIVVLPMMFNPTNATISSLQFNLELPKGVKPDVVKAGSILATASKSVKTHLKGRTWTFIIFGVNQNKIASGDLLTAHLKIAPGVTSGSWAVPISGVVYTDPKGTPVTGGANTDGTLTVTAP